MPWIKDINNEPKYSPSDYVKEELPTWNEIYNEFWLKKIFTYDNFITDDNKLDSYWKIPYRKYLLGLICNQFNKNLFEDGKMDYVIKKLNDYINKNDNVNPDIKSSLIKQIRFFLFINMDPISDDILIKYKSNKESKPVIYTFGDIASNPFITNTRNRIDLTSKSIEIISILASFILDINGEEYVYIPYQSEDGIYKYLFDVMMEDYINYFEGSSIGWKDENGNIINDDINNATTGCVGSGFDPAL